MNHITIEEMKSLSQNELDILLYICNVWAPIRPPIPNEEFPHPITPNILRCAHREAIIDRVKQAESVIKDESKEIYNGLKTKLGI